MLGGHAYGSLNRDQVKSLNSSIQSITLDFEGIDLEELIDPLELSITPNTNLIDLKTFDRKIY